MFQTDVFQGQFLSQEESLWKTPSDYLLGEIDEKNYNVSMRSVRCSVC